MADAALRWRTGELEAALSSVLPGCTVQVLESIDSTNSELMRRARAGRLEPMLLVAEQQTAGRGRLGRAWHSSGPVPQHGDPETPADGPAWPALTFSLGLALAPRDWSGLSLAVGVSVAQSLHPALQLKWPNDIWLQDRKLGGILIETASVGEQRHVVIGIGINIAPRDAAGLSTAPAWLQELLPGMEAPQLLQRLLLPLAQAMRLFEEQGFAPFHALFRQRDALAGRSVVLSNGTQGRAAGVDASGALLVHTAAGMQHITSAEVSVRPASAVAERGTAAPRN